ncbi:hypothetical protein ACQJBY_034892 [Aegilops geniculata]
MQRSKRMGDHTKSLRKVQSTTREKNNCGSNRKRVRKHNISHQEEADAASDKHFVNSLPDRDVSSPKFEEQQFGSVYESDQDHWCQLSQRVASHLSTEVVSLALLDGEEMLFACTGIVLPRGTSSLGLTRFLTSSRLVTVFNQKRNKDDKLRVAVRLPDKKTIPGILGLYDKYIAIVTSQDFQNVMPLDMYQETYLPDALTMVAAGRAHKSCSLMGTIGALTDAPVGDDYEHLSASTWQITEAGLGGPLIDLAGNFVGMNICFNSDTGKPLFLPWILLRQRLEQYEILGPWAKLQGKMTPYSAGFSTWKTNNSRQGSYVPPPGASRIIPSGFMDTWNWIESMGYPKPEPLMLELNGRLVRTFDDVFGCLHAWRGYKGFYNAFGSGKNAWQRLEKKIVETISRRVVSLVSFNGNDMRFFVCTGFLVKCPLTNGGTRTVIVTSASLVRTCEATDTIDENMRIEVFLPPNQRLNGTLESYHPGYNVAIVTVKGLRKGLPEDLELHPDSLPRRVVAIGREPKGLLCASMGEPILGREDLDKRNAFGCKDLRLSDCQITKIGIGGPLVNFFNGSLVGMNFYDGRPSGTPFLPCKQIFVCDCSIRHLTYDTMWKLTLDGRWPVPPPFWYHGWLEVSRFGPMRMRGRVLQ